MRRLMAIPILALACLAAAGCQTAQPAPPPDASPSSPVPVATRSAIATTPSADTSAPPPATVRPRPATVDSRTGAGLDRPFIVEGLAVVSKRHPISKRFVPARVGPHGLTAATQRALASLQAAASKAGVRVVVRSGYRSYATQAGILAAKIREYGSEALARRYNAAPGRSEHQTGLAVDLWDGVTWGLAVRNTATGRWLWANAWRYGFVLRYPPGKEAITGYAYEPWHFRFIGRDHSSSFGANSTTTLEEYLGIR